jgi:hypothetical protein
MLKRLLPLLVCAATFGVCAQPADPLKTAECGDAIGRVQQARGAKARDVERLRQEAARMCFGTASPPVRGGRVARQPVAVPPPQIELRARAPSPGQPAPLPAPVQIDRPATVSSCDPGGCWVNDGVRLQRVPPILMAPSGLCAAAPGAAGCP